MPPFASTGGPPPSIKPIILALLIAFTLLLFTARADNDVYYTVSLPFSNSEAPVVNSGEREKKKRKDKKGSAQERPESLDVMFENGGSLVLYNADSAYCEKSDLDDFFTTKDGGVTPVVASTEQELIQQALQWFVHNLTQSAYSHYAPDDPALAETMALVRQLESLLVPYGGYSEGGEDYITHGQENPEYVRELARLASDMMWTHGFVEEPPKLRRESAVELVGMGVIIFATALGAMVLRSQRRGTSAKMQKALKVAVIKKLKRQPPAVSTRTPSSLQEEPEAERPQPSAATTSTSRHGSGHGPSSASSSHQNNQHHPRDKPSRGSNSNNNKVRRQLLVELSREVETPPAQKITIQSAIAASQALQNRPTIVPKKSRRSTKNRSRVRAQASKSTTQSELESTPVQPAREPLPAEGSEQPPTPSEDRLIDPFAYTDLSDPETSRPIPIDPTTTEDDEEEEEEEEEDTDNDAQPIGEGNRDDWRYTHPIFCEWLEKSEFNHNSEVDRLLELKRAEELRGAAEHIEPPPRDIGGFTSVLGERPASSTTRFRTDIMPRSDKRRILMGARKVVGGMAFIHEMPAPPMPPITPAIAQLLASRRHPGPAMLEQPRQARRQPDSIPPPGPWINGRSGGVAKPASSSERNRRCKAYPKASAEPSCSTSERPQPRSPRSRAQGAVPRKRDVKRVSMFRLLTPNTALDPRRISPRS